MIIGISGKIGSGKDTVKDIISKYLTSKGYSTNHCSFGAKVKMVVALLTETSYDLQTSHEGKNTIDPVFGLTYGVLQQRVGEGLRVAISSDVWVKSAFAVEENNDEIKIFSDVRYPEEMDEILRRGGYVIRIEGDPIGERARSTRNLNHHSEIALDTAIFDLVIENNGTRKDLERKVIQWIEEILIH